MKKGTIYVNAEDLIDRALIDLVALHRGGDVPVEEYNRIIEDIIMDTTELIIQILSEDDNVK